MSLDVYLYDEPDPFAIAEIKRALVDAYGPARADDLMAAANVKEGGDPDRGSIFSSNMTHNLAGMAAEAGAYEACWRPHLLLATPEERALIGSNPGANDHPLFARRGDVERDLEERGRAGAVRARLLIGPLREALEALKADPDRFRKHEPENGWGNYEGLVRFVASYLAACEAYPNARVRASR